LEVARKSEERVVQLEAEKEELSAQVEEVEEERDVVKEEWEEYQAESETDKSDLREEVDRLRRLLDDAEMEEMDVDEGAYAQIKDLEREVLELRTQLERETRMHLTTGEGSGSGGETRAESRPNGALLARIRELEAELEATRYAPNVAGLMEENRRYREQLAELMTGSGRTAAEATMSGLVEEERAELERLRQRIAELELQLLRTKQTKVSDEDLQRELLEAETLEAEAEADVTRIQAQLDAAIESRKETLRDRALSEKKYRAIEDLRLTLGRAVTLVRTRKGKLTKLRNQVKLRQQAFALEEEASKRTKRTEARVMMV